MSFDLISDQSQITAEWMTSVLRSSETISGATSVSTIAVKDLGEEGGLLSLIYRATMTYDGGVGPDAAIVKIPVPDPVQRGTADVLGFYARELAFYAEMAPSAPFGAPTMYGSRMAEDSTDFVLVMQDLAHLRSVDQVDGVSLEDAKLAITKMAEFHAPWWEHADLPSMTDRYLPVENPVYLAALPDVFGGGWAGCQEFGGDKLTTEVIELGNRFGSLVPWLLSEMNTPATFVHGDWRADNVFFGGDKGIAMIDFQISGFATGLYDVAYFISQSIDTDVRRGHDEALVRHYLAVLAENGVDYDFDEAWRKYQICLAHCFIYGVSSFASWGAWNERQQDLLRTMLGRSVQAILDNDALSVLPDRRSADT